MSAAAEALPVASSSVDLVTVAQAWHWMDGRRRSELVYPYTTDVFRARRR